MTSIMFVDAGGDIDAGAMVTAEMLFLDYKAPVPTHFDKMVVKQVKPFHAQVKDVVYGVSVLEAYLEERGSGGEEI